MLRLCREELTRLSKQKSLDIITTPVLLDIVGVTGLQNTVDSYCTVTVNGKEIHRTKVVADDDSPIWTVESGSLCLLHISNEPPLPEQHGDVTICIWASGKVLGRIELLNEELLNGQSERQERVLLSSTEIDAIFAFRSRCATADDILFFQRKNWHDTQGLASDINFRTVRRTPIFQRHRKVVDGTEYFRVKPIPDPEVPDQKWLTPDQVEEKTLKPSRNWVSAGHGSLGTIHLEILSCDNLPNMDLSPNDYSDPFVGIVFEDTMVRTDVIFDTLSPRWLPWTNRAFIFNVRHPTSILMLGVFDYDDAPIDYHDAIGRIVLNTNSFRSKTEYTMSFNLHHDPRQMDPEPRGTIRIRLRVDWQDESEAMKLSFIKPPRCVINVDNEKSYQVLKYITRGALDMEEVTLDTIKLYVREFISNREGICYLLDVLLEVILWRGRLKLTNHLSIWFPIHSILLFGSGAVLIERPQSAIPIFLYAISWILLSNNYHLSRHPNPWKCVKKTEEVNFMAITGRSHFSPQRIEPNEGFEDGAKTDQLDKMKKDRMMKIMGTLLRFMLRVYRMYSKTNHASFEMNSEVSSWLDLSIVTNIVSNLLANHLYYVHMLFKYFCKYSRLLRNFVNWKSFSTDVVTTNCFMIATLWLIFPMNTILLWLCRIWIWSVLGPWMKLVDIVWVHPWYETKEELMQRIEEGNYEDHPVPNLEALLNSRFFRKMSHSGRVVAETSMKEKDMRIYKFGCYGESVPLRDTSRFPSVPLPQSYSRVVPDEEIKDQPKPVYHIPGQMLEGTMIQRRPKLDEESLDLARKVAEEKKFE